MTKVGAVSRAHESSLGTTTTSAPATPASAPRAAPASSALAVIVTGSKRAIARATSTYVARAFSRSSQFSGRHGQAIQQPACAAHSGGHAKAGLSRGLHGRYGVVRVNLQVPGSISQG